MKQERVIAILDFYRDIDKTVTMNERVIRNLEDQYYSTLGAVNSDGMPHGKGGVSNPVERVVLNIPQSVSDTIANMRRENERLTAIKGEILSELNALNYREKAVIYGFYIDGLQWERLSQRVNYSPRQCRNIRNIALDRLAKRFEQNKRISRYVFPEKEDCHLLPVFPAIIGIVKSEHNDTGGAFLHAAGSLKTDHVLNMARFLRTSAATPGTKNEKQTKGGAADAWRESETRNVTKPGGYGLIPAAR